MGSVTDEDRNYLPGPGCPLGPRALLGARWGGEAALADLWGAQLAAQLLVESANLERVQTWNARKRDTVRAWLQERLLTDARLPARERALAGDNLAQLGDGRFDPEH